MTEEMEDWKGRKRRRERRRQAISLERRSQYKRELKKERECKR